MSAESVVAALAALLVLNVLIAIATLGPTVLARLRASQSPREPLFRPNGGASGSTNAVAELDRSTVEPVVGRNETYDRIFRIASWIFLLAATVIVAASGMWTARLPEIVILVAITGAFVLLIHDILPAGTLRPIRAILQAVVAVGFASMLVVLTGGYDSPFFFAFPLIVGGGALVLGPLAALALVVLAAAGYLAAASSISGMPSAFQIVATTVNLTGLFLLAYIASVVAREQRGARDAALRLSSLDSLTGLYNRTFFFSALEREIARSDRSGRGFCLVMLDLDELKDVNDRHGHHAGDVVLRAVAETVRNGVRRIDIAARYGGDEFVAILPETDPTGGWVVAEKIRLGVNDATIPGIAFSPTVSVGVVSYPTDGRTADALIVSADRAMYVSKRGGKNRVASVGVEPAPVPIEPGEKRRRERAG
ncbi:MAG: GGDEF domain-containing protein [Chloroflexota bacterium]